MALSDSSSKTRNKRLCLGIISGVHGIHGEVVIKSHTQNPLDIKSYGPLSDEQGTRRFTIDKARLAKKGVVARLEGIEDRNSAEALKGIGLYVDQSVLPVLEDEDEFYLTELIGLAVQLPDGQSFGTVTALHNFGAGDLIEIKPRQGKSTEIYPFDRQTVPKVDLAQGTLTLSPPEIIAPKDDSRPLSHRKKTG